MPDSPPIDRTFSALYRHSMDTKRRIPIPFRWRPEESAELTIVVWPKHRAGTCLRVLPPDQWTKLRATINLVPNTDPNKAVLKHWIGTGSIQTKLDSAGRLTIPEEMAAAADISNQVVLAGMIDYFEIWNSARYEVVEATSKAHLGAALQLLE